MSSEQKKERVRFITLKTNDCILRDCVTGVNYHLETKEEVAELGHAFNLMYSHNSELALKLQATETENAKLRNLVSGMERN